MIPWDIHLSKGSLTGKSETRKNAKESPEDTSNIEKQPTVTIKAYIGMDYECPIGHRFICSGPDRLVKVSSNGIIKV